MRPAFAGLAIYVGVNMREFIIISPIRAIRAKCVDCCGDSIYEVKNCLSIECPLYEYRFGKNPYFNTGKSVPILKVVRTKCVECSGTRTEADTCPIKDCPLYSFRKGKNPYRKRKLTENEVERLKKIGADTRWKASV